MSFARRLTRRRALAEAFGGAAGLGLAGGAGGLLLAGCGAAARPAASGSTLRSTWVDPAGDGQLRVGPGEPLRARTELGPAAAPAGAPLVTFAHLTDAHVLDASSPARVPFLNRLGPPFQSTFRPHETLTVQVLAGAAHAVRALAPAFVLQGGDLIDNDQANELHHALAALAGGTVSPGSGRDGYDGVQLASDTDPFYYRPDLDDPRHPGLLRAAIAPLRSAGLGAPALPVFGDHDALVAGTVAPTPLTRSLALGDRALWNLPTDLRLPADLRAENAASPDGPPDPGAVDALLRQALRGPTVRVWADPTRRELAVAETLARLRAAVPASTAFAPRPAGAPGERLDYVVDLGAHVELVVLDLVRRAGGSGGLVVSGQAAWLAARLAEAQRSGRWVIVATHQPLLGATGGGPLIDLLDRAPRVIALLNGHIHRNSVIARPTAAGGYWLIGTASLIDYPQQARALRLQATAGGGIAIHTWMLDHAGDGRLGEISRELAYLDAQGGRPEGFAGSALDRNVVLYRAAIAQ